MYRRVLTRTDFSTRILFVYSNINYIKNLYVKFVNVDGNHALKSNTIESLVNLCIPILKSLNNLPLLIHCMEFAQKIVENLTRVFNLAEQKNALIVLVS